MCRLYGFRANEETKVECTLVHAQNALMRQSASDRLGRAHADGWGIGFYHNSIPELERRATPAYEDLHFSSTAERVYSRAVVAHVRLATVGSPNVANAHPFTHQHWTFAHNGTVRAFDVLQPELIAETDPVLQAERAGQTDSEQLFLWLMTRINEAGIDADNDPSPDGIAAVLGASIGELASRCESAGAEDPPRLNTVLTNGHIMVGTRWNNDLYAVVREGVRDCEICGIPHVHHDKSIDYRAVIVASEPISHETWQEVPNHSVFAVGQDIDLTIRPIQSLPSRTVIF